MSQTTHPGETAVREFSVRGFSEAVLRDLREEGIRVTLIEPGAVDTPMQTDDGGDGSRMLDPEDIADAIVYAVSRPEHVCVNGIQLVPMNRREGE